jgi:hypothetical protein
MSTKGIHILSFIDRKKKLIAFGGRKVVENLMFISEILMTHVRSSLCLFVPRNNNNNNNMFFVLCINKSMCLFWHGIKLWEV